MDYKKLYYELFNKVVDATEMLKDIQIQMEQKVVSDESNTAEEAE